MQRTATAIIDVIQAHRFAHLTDAGGLEYLNRVYGDLIAALPSLLKLGNAAPITITFTAGDQEKPLSAPFLNQIDYALWVPASGAPSKIPVVTVESLNRGTTGGGVPWRDAVSADPTSCYLITDFTGQRIGCNSKVPAGSLKLYGSPLSAVLTGAEVMPPLPNDSVVVEGISYYYMMDRGRPVSASYFQAYVMEQAKLKTWLMTFPEEFQNEERNVRES